MPSSEKGQPYCDGGPSYLPTQLYTAITTTNATDIITGAPPNGGKWIVDDVIVSADAACNVLIQDDTGTPKVLARVFFPSAGTVQLTPRDGFRLAGVNQKIQAKASAANIYVFASAHEEVA